MRTIEARARITAEAGGLDAFKKLASAFKGVEQTAKALEKVRPAFGWGETFTKDLEKLKLTQGELDRVRKSFDEMRAGMGRMKAFEGLSQIERWKAKTIADLQAVRREYDSTGRAHDAFFRRAGRFAVGAAGIGGGAVVSNRAGRAAITAAAEDQRTSAGNWAGGLTSDEDGRIKMQSLGLSATRYRSVDAGMLHEAISDTAKALRDVDRAMELSETIAKGLSVLKLIKGGDKAVEESRQFFKGVGTLGVTDPGAVTNLIDGWLRALSTEGADLSMGGFLQLVRQSRAAGANLSPRFLTTMAPQLGQDLGDAQLGTSLASGLSQTIGERATKKSIAEMQRYGVRDKRGRLVNEGLYLSDPDLWAYSTLVPALRKRGVDVNDNKAVTAVLAKLFSNRTVNDVMQKIVQQRSDYEKGARWYTERAKGLDAADGVMTRDPYSAFEGVLSQMKNLATVLAGPYMQTAIDNLNSLAEVLGRLAKAGQDDPAKAKEMAENAGLAAGATGALGLYGLSRWLGRGRAVGEAAARRSILFNPTTIAAGGLLSLRGDAGPVPEWAKKKFHPIPPGWDYTLGSRPGHLYGYHDHGEIPTSGMKNGWAPPPAPSGPFDRFQPPTWGGARCPT